MQAQRQYAKAKFFSRSPKLLQQIGEAIEDHYKDNCVIGRILPAAEGDLYLMITVYSEEVNR